MTEAYHELPPDLPPPVDDGGADHLPGTELPPGLELESASGERLDLRRAAGSRLVAYVYPRTGTPGIPLAEGWDDIPGARGCTPQSCAYRDALEDFAHLGAAVIGISAQPAAEQREFAAREQIPFPLLNDSELILARQLGLPTFEAGGMTLYKRLTLIAEAGRITKAFYPVFPPDRDASAVLAWLAGAPRARNAVRVLLVDERERVLLLRGVRPDDGGAFWFPAGGGLEPGEDARAAAVREVAEETGLADVPLGPEIWRRRHRFEWRGVTWDQRERWFLARVPHFEPSGAAMTATEREEISDCRWWSIAEMEATDDDLVPRDLARRLRELLAEGPPEEPSEIGV